MYANVDAVVGYVFCMFLRIFRLFLFFSSVSSLLPVCGCLRRCGQVTCISPAFAFAEETVNSLNYAQKAMVVHPSLGNKW